MLVAVVNRLNTNNPEIQKFSEPEIRDPALFMRTGVGMPASVSSNIAGHERPSGLSRRQKSGPISGATV